MFSWACFVAFTPTIDFVFLFALLTFIPLLIIAPWFFFMQPHLIFSVSVASDETLTTSSKHWAKKGRHSSEIEINQSKTNIRKRRRKRQREEESDWDTDDIVWDLGSSHASNYIFQLHKLINICSNTHTHTPTCTQRYFICLFIYIFMY